MRAIIIAVAYGQRLQLDCAFLHDFPGRKDNLVLPPMQSGCGAYNRPTTSKWLTYSSKLARTARASGSTTPLFGSGPAYVQMAYMESQRVSTINSTSRSSLRRSKYAPRCPAMALSFGNTTFVAC